MQRSGLRSVVFNTRERALSDDQNFESDYSAYGLVEVLRYLLDADQNVDTTPGYESLGVGTETPQRRAYVLAGVRFEPLAGSVSSIVSPGAMLFIDNPGSVRDSLATLVEDAGLQTLGILTLTAGGGATRIDVVECQPVLTLEQSDNRDIFNPTTGLFVPTAVPKVRAAHLNYRIRTGTAGGGFPGLAAGWVPIAVCSVPAGAANWDAVTVWDVRPLVPDRAEAPFGNIRQEKAIERAEIYSDISVAGQVRLIGEAVGRYRDYKAGGRLNPQVGYVDIRAAAHRAGNFAGFPASAFSQWTLYSVFPFGLPRWVQYSTTAPRVPTGQRGILAVTTVSPLYDGRPSSVISVPSAYGLVHTPSQDAIALVSGRCTSAGLPVGVTAEGRSCSFLNPDANPRLPTAASALTARWEVVAGSAFPGNARRLFGHILGVIDVTVTSGPLRVSVEGLVEVSNPNTSVVYKTRARAYGQSALYGDLASAATIGYEFRFEVPLPADFALAGRTFQILWTANPIVGLGLGTAAINAAVTEMTIDGWEV